jgi:hypothetical protein
MAVKPPNIETRHCLIVSPEFARQLVNALLNVIQTYEANFGPLRPEPSPQQVLKLKKPIK